MCIAILTKPGTTVPKQQLKTAFKANSDGAGLSWINRTKKTVEVRKGYFKFKTWWKSYQELINLGIHKYGPILLHARIATSGKINKANCHPFQVNKNLAVAHNGIIPDLSYNCDYSDTNLFVIGILPLLPNNFLENKGILELMSGYIGNSKLVFIQSSGKFTIVNESLGTWKNGIWYSNDSYKKQTQKNSGIFPKHYSGNYSPLAKSKITDKICINCGMQLYKDEVAAKMCEVCIDDISGAKQSYMG